MVKSIYKDKSEQWLYGVKAGWRELIAKRYKESDLLK